MFATAGRNNGIRIVVGAAAVLVGIAISLAAAGPSRAAASGGYLWVYGSTINAYTGLAMQGGTSPSIAPVPGGAGEQVAFQASNGALELYQDKSEYLSSMALGLDPVTSPSIASDGTVAFTGSNTELLWSGNGFNSTTYASTGQTETAGASPAVAALSGGGDEYVFDNANHVIEPGDGTNWNDSTGYGIQPGTSPVIAGLAGGEWQAAFNANQTDYVFTWNSANGPQATDQVMSPNTNPAVTGLPTQTAGWEIAFEGQNDQLGVIGSDGNADDLAAMAAGTSPGIAGLAGGGYVIAFQGTNGDLWTYASASGATTDTGQPMTPGTSPAITASGSGYEIAYQGPAPAPPASSATQPGPSTTTSSPTTGAGATKLVVAPRLKSVKRCSYVFKGKGTKRHKVRTCKRVQVLGKPGTATRRRGGSAHAYGLLETKAGTPVKAAQIVINRKVAGHPAVTVGSRRTNASGRFSFPLSGPNSTYTFRFAGTVQLAPASAGQKLNAVATTSITLPRRIAADGAFTIGGTVKGGYIPSGGLLVELFYRVKHARSGWQPFVGTIHTSRTGRWRIRVPVSAGARGYTYQFQARVPHQAAWPWLYGLSGTVTRTVH